jgi:hypothetical protein
MAEITFHANTFAAVATTDPSVIDHAAGSGLGFFGGGFGISVPVGQYQESTFVTNSNGTTSGVKVANTQYTSISGIKHNGTAVTHGTSGTPNYYAPLNIRFTHDSGVRVQNCKLRIFDRNDITKHASGVTTQVLELRHPHPVDSYNAGSGSLAYRGSDNFAWNEFDPTDGTIDSSTEVTFTSSPGVSGMNTSAAETLPQVAADGKYNWISNSGAALSDTRHDWFVALSASPDSIGSKTNYGLYFTLEYL